MSDNLYKFIKKISKGSIKYSDPRKINCKIIDRKIRKSISLINKSNWCWTLWSCQGHIQGKDSITLPYITFVVKQKYTSILLNYIFELLPLYDNNNFPVCPNCYLTINRGFSDNKYCIISVHFSKEYVEKYKLLHTLHKNLFQMSLKVKKFDGK